jgi:hypothetical protein
MSEDVGNCVSKDSITQCNNYWNTNQCEADDTIGGIGCKWDNSECVINKEKNKKIYFGGF